MMELIDDVMRTIKTRKRWMTTVMILAMVTEVTCLSGPNVCMVKQKYNVTKRVKYRAPMSVRTYEWCFSMPPRCSRWNTEMRDLTRLETEERTAEMSVCCPGYKMKDVSCIEICPSGKTGPRCSEDCPPSKWGPNCVHYCDTCDKGYCSAVTGECQCLDGWQGERCKSEASISATGSAALMEQLLTPTKSTTTSATKTTHQPTTVLPSTISRSTEVEIISISATIPTTIDNILPTTKAPLNSPRKTMAKIPEITSESSILTEKSTVIYNNQTMTTVSNVPISQLKPEDASKKYWITSIYDQKEISTQATNRTYPTKQTTKAIYQTTKATLASEIITSTLKTDLQITSIETIPVSSITTMTTTTETPILSTQTLLKDGAKKPETTTEPPMTVAQPATIKFKPKEIWIKPAQKGESPLFETRLKPNQELHHKYKSATNNDMTPENTTQKTIIVSIIPTSVSYATFKKIALTTALYISNKTNATVKSYNKSSDQGQTKPMTVQTTPTPVSVKMLNTLPKKANSLSTVTSLFMQNANKTKTYSFTTKETFKTSPELPLIQTINSMSSTFFVGNRISNSSILLTSNFSTNTIQTTRLNNTSESLISTSPPDTTPSFKITRTVIDNYSNKKFVTIKQENVTIKSINVTVTDVPVTKTLVRKQVDTNNSKKNLTNSNSETNTVTDDPTKDEETFHILTEPEHITAVMDDKGSEKTSVDLISVISIAGGVMMAIITLAVVIVMLERCKKPRYEDVRKYNDIRMQVMIDNNDVPPPYVRSIFHTPLPDPPCFDKCHYQPISTLDRNLKQFMRPVVVQTISPLMLENFRGILECHYDHLPRRSHDMGTMQTRCSISPSMGECEELLQHRSHTVTDSTIDAMKCEAKLDVIDTTTSEPLYAEIPCWRPPSEHAIEVVNLNGEAVTEL